MKKELAKTYAPTDVEDKWYSFWEEQGYFKPSRDPEAEMFSIVMPPPNVTGRLHMGHAMDNTMQDILIRFKRLQGYNTMWLPGTDHAGIATQAKVEKQLNEEGISKHDLGRDRFVDRCWAWKEEYGDTITKQIRKLGASCDWSQERFTMDETCSRAVREAFVALYEKDLIYQGNYIINWCPHCHTTISDIEVEHKENNGELYYLNYPYAEGEGYITIATTRPETMFGDVAVAVHPEDERYKDLVGKELILPIIERRIPVVADEYVDREFGTGAVKITPSHDVNDFEMGQRHNLPQEVIMDEDGIMTEGAGPYEGLDRFECRKQLLADLEGTPYLNHVEPYQNAVGHCYRCDTIIEPRVSKQWFVRMKPLVEPALEAVHTGEIKFVPERFTKIFVSWLENIRDWCISRQLWWGHRIPVWYCDECGEVICTREDPTVCPSCGSNHLHQDDDVLDTWFSSGLWPFETFGWPDDTPDLRMFYPTSVLVTGRDIIFFWVARMVFDAYEFTGKKPFDDVLIHGLVLDDKGRKMSKSLGNGIDPLEEIERFGADALRMTLVTGTTPGNDTRYRQEKIEASRNFTNKLWNAARFVLMNLDDIDDEVSSPALNHLHDRWIVSRFQRVAEHTTDALNKYELGEAARSVSDFIWDEFCDWYIELAKPRLYGRHGDAAQTEARCTAAWVLRETCVLLHPIMPFITEELWQHLPHELDSIMQSEWPKSVDEYIDVKAENDMAVIMDTIKAVRSLRHDMGVPMGKKSPIVLIAQNNKRKMLLHDHEEDFFQLAFASEMIVEESPFEYNEQAVSTVEHGIQVILPLKGLVDVQAEITRLEKEAARVQNEITRAEKKLSNSGFVSKAPAEVVEKEKRKINEYRLDAETISERIKMLKEL